MKKNFASLGTALSRDEAKKVVGGLLYDDGEGEGGGGACAAHYAQCGCGIVCCENLTCTQNTDGSQNYCGA